MVAASAGLHAWIIGRTAAAKVALDQFVYVPFVFFPAFYTVDAVVRREEPVLLAARDRYLREIWRTCVDTWPFSTQAWNGAR